MQYSELTVRLNVLGQSAPVLDPHGGSHSKLVSNHVTS